jgi:hypothetical protein
MNLGKYRQWLLETLHKKLMERAGVGSTGSQGPTDKCPGTLQAA